MTFEECKEIAEKYIDVRYCREYRDAYVFDDRTESDGGGEIVIIKETGKALTFVQFILQYHPEKKPVNEYVINCAGNEIIKP